MRAIVATGVGGPEVLELQEAPDPEPGQDPRHVGTIEPSWNLLDLTPDGRPGDWDEQLRYDSCRD